MFQACTSQTWTKWGSSTVIQFANCAISKYLSSSCRSLARIHRALEMSPRKPPSATVVNASTGGAFSSGCTSVSPNRSRSWFKVSCTWDTPASKTTATSSSRIFFHLELMCLLQASSLGPLGGGQLSPRKDEDPKNREAAAE